MEESNKDALAIVGYNLATIRSRYGIYEERILTKVLEKAQYDMRRKYYGETNLPQGAIWDSGEYVIDMTMQDIMGQSHEYTAVKKALENVQKEYIQYTQGKQWIGIVLFPYAKADYGTGKVQIKMMKEGYALLTDFAKGHRFFNPVVAGKLQTTYAVRIYRIIANQGTPITYNIEEFKKMLGVGDKYRDASAFIKRCIQPAQIEIDNEADFTFTYKSDYVKEGKGRPKAKNIMLIPVNLSKVQSIDIETLVGYGTSAISAKVWNSLTQDYKFSANELKGDNLRLILEAESIMQNPTLIEFLDRKRDKARQAENSKGWILNAIKGEITNK